MFSNLQADRWGKHEGGGHISLGIADANLVTNFSEGGIRELRQQVWGYPIKSMRLSTGRSSSSPQVLICKWVRWL